MPGLQASARKEREAMTDQLFYVQDTRQIVGNCALWWCPKGAGYTTEIDKAGLYTAEQVSGMRETDVGWPKELVDRLIVRHVRLDMIHDEDLSASIKGGCR